MSDWIPMLLNVTLKSGECVTLQGTRCYYGDNPELIPIGDLPQEIIDELIEGKYITPLQE